MAPLPLGSKLLSGAFLASGTLHLVKPNVFEPLMPDFVPAHREIIIGSGVAEIACALGMLLPPTRRVAGLASAALLVGVFPGNLKMADDARRLGSPTLRAVAYGRLPLQLPMIKAALNASKA
ncbi:DoxX family protein [Nocardioides sp.]|uniref:DoxX family protein n=1 Tax=Nocardioides sp. TaxID=35761 RepID=UPI002C19FF16|nr:DoxX family protein [Nocardioides sp.]HSX67504.1 DoxX family protein [Nocardioides sp.]